MRKCQHVLWLFLALSKFYLMELSSSSELVRLVERGGGKEGMPDLDLVAVFSVTPAASGVGFLKKRKKKERKELQVPQKQKQFH